MTSHPAYVCPNCGKPIPHKIGRGRPRLWCSDTCRRIVSYLASLENLISSPELTVTQDKCKQLRAQIWALANNLNGKKQ